MKLLADIPVTPAPAGHPPLAVGGMSPAYSACTFQYVRLELMRLFYQIQEFVSGTLVFEEDSAEG